MRAGRTGEGRGREEKKDREGFSFYILEWYTMESVQNEHSKSNCVSQKYEYPRFQYMTLLVICLHNY